MLSWRCSRSWLTSWYLPCLDIFCFGTGRIRGRRRGRSITKTEMQDAFDYFRRENWNISCGIFLYIIFTIISFTFGISPGKYNLAVHNILAVIINNNNLMQKGDILFKFLPAWSKNIVQYRDLFTEHFFEFVIGGIRHFSVRWIWHMNNYGRLRM